MFILPKIPSFGERLAESLTGGIGKGVDLATQLGIEGFKNKQRSENIQRIEQGNQSPIDQENVYRQLMGQLSSQGNEGEFNEKDSQSEESSIGNQLWQKLQGSSQQQKSNDPFQKAKQYAAIGEHEMARVATEEAKLIAKQQARQEERDFLPKKQYIEHAGKENTDYLTEIGQVEKDLPTTEFSLAMMEDALGDAGKWSAAKDWLADHTDYKGFRSAAGAELDSAIKNYFLGDLTSIKGGRANVFLEKQIRDAYPSAGQDPISNQKIVLGMKLKEGINKLKVEKVRELERKYIDKQGYLPPDFKSIVNAQIKGGVERLEKDAIDKLHHMTKIEESRDKMFRKYIKDGETLMMDPEGNPYAVKKSEVSMYREQGYIPLGKK